MAFVINNGVTVNDANQDMSLGRVEQTSELLKMPNEMLLKIAGYVGTGSTAYEAGRNAAAFSRTCLLAHAISKAPRTHKAPRGNVIIYKSLDKIIQIANAFAKEAIDKETAPLLTTPADELADCVKNAMKNLEIALLGLSTEAFLKSICKVICQRDPAPGQERVDAVIDSMNIAMSALSGCFEGKEWINLIYETIQETGFDLRAELASYRDSQNIDRKAVEEFTKYTQEADALHARLKILQQNDQGVDHKGLIYDAWISMENQRQLVAQLRADFLSDSVELQVLQESFRSFSNLENNFKSLAEEQKKIISRLDQLKDKMNYDTIRERIESESDVRANFIESLLEAHATTS